MTDHAKAAKMIKAELKKAFPKTVFSVRSKGFAGGDAVHIDWTDGPTNDQVRNITDKYQYGHFDGMQDLYEYSNNRTDIPQAKYVQVRRDISDQARQIIIAELNKYEEIHEKGYSDNTFYESFQSWGNTLVNRESWNRVF